MEARDTKQDTSKAYRSLYTKSDWQVGSDQQSRKRVRDAKNEEPTKNTCKSPRLQENPKKRRRNAETELQTRPLRKSPRLQEIRDLNQQRFKQAKKRMRSPPGTTRAHHRIGQKRPQAGRRVLNTTELSSGPSTGGTIPSPLSRTMLAYTLYSRPQHTYSDKLCSRWRKPYFNT
ncbi:hypothetical protein MMC25_008358 [Agyrium rufum]|nr:hypothetical protein [Agyrium rufum]